jgi:DNA-binding HxlR family transcriptional regulator
MKKVRSKSASQCPISFALDLFGDRWSLLIIRDVVFKKKCHFREFLTSPEKISTNILAARLAKLEANNLLIKTVDPENASGFIYRLTSKGRDLVPLLLEMTSWSAKHDPTSVLSDSVIDGAPRQLLRRLKKDRQSLLSDILKNIPK